MKNDRKSEDHTVAALDDVPNPIANAGRNFLRENKTHACVDLCIRTAVPRHRHPWSSVGVARTSWHCLIPEDFDGIFPRHHHQSDGKDDEDMDTEGSDNGTHIQCERLQQVAEATG